MDIILTGEIAALKAFASAIAKRYRRLKPIPKVSIGGKRYSGMHLRLIRARNGVGRPPRRAA